MIGKGKGEAMTKPAKTVGQSTIEPHGFSNAPRAFNQCGALSTDRAPKLTGETDDHQASDHRRREAGQGLDR
jgi:hypothetical protein